MEIYQLKYFVEVAKKENMNQVYRDSGISTPALSKAISLLEAELGVSLFERNGKKLRLTLAGNAFLQKATQILDLIQDSTIGIKSAPNTLSFIVCGEEFCLDLIGIPLIKYIKTKYPEIQVKFNVCSGEEALKQAANGNCDFSLTTQAPPDSFAKKVVCNFEMITCIGQKNYLYKQVKSGVVFPVSKLIKLPFVAPNTCLFGNMGGVNSYDGWRDDIHPRNISYITSSLQLITSLVQSGECIAYLPKFFAEKMGFEQIKVSHCEFNCEQNIYLSTSKHEKIGWISNVLSGFPNV